MADETFAITRAELAQMREMRRLQQLFFRGDKTVVGQAKSAERAVDKILARFPDENAEKTQPNLFTDREPSQQLVGAAVGSQPDEQDDERGPWWVQN